MPRREWKWTSHQLDKLNKVIASMDVVGEYKPLTLRQIYYQLVKDDYIKNNKSQYTMLSNLLKWARIDGHVSWDDIEDRGRSFHDLTGWLDPQEYLDQVSRNVLKGYRLDVMHHQDKYIEIWIEKDALMRIFTRVANPYRISVVVCKGFSSVSFLKDYKDRLSHRPGWEPVILYFGDFDPSGKVMADTMEITLRDELDISDLTIKHIALSYDDIFKYSLPHNPEAIKPKDSRTKKHVEEYGMLAVELDALSPDILVQKIRDAIHTEIDLDLYNEEIERQNIELQEVASVREKVLEVLRMTR